MHTEETKSVAKSSVFSTDKATNYSHLFDRRAHSKIKNRNTAQFTKRLFIDTLTRGGEYRAEMREIELSLDTKTWLVNVALMLSRILYPIFGIAHW